MDVMAPFTYFIISLLHVEETKLTLWSDKIRKGRWGAFWGNIFFFFLPVTLYLILSHSVSFSLSNLFPLNLSPGSFHLMICRTHIVYSVLDWTLLEKKHTSEHRFNARTRVWNTPLKSSCTRLLKFTRKTQHSNTETLLHASVCPCTYTHTHPTSHVMNGVHSHVQTHAHTHNDLHVILKKKQIYPDFRFPIWSHKSDIYNHTVTAQ